MAVVSTQEKPSTRFEDYLFAKRAERVVIYIFIIGLALFNLVPFIWLFVSALGVKPAEFSSLYLFTPTGLTLQHFAVGVARQTLAPHHCADALLLADPSVGPIK